MYDTEIHNENTIIHLSFEHPQKCTSDAFYRSKSNKIDIHTQVWSINYFNYNENTIHKQNLTNITAKHYQ